MLDGLINLFILCALLGAVVGVLAGLLGIGGGLLIVPALIYLLPQYLSISQAVLMPMAIATSLSTIILTASSSALAHYRMGQVKRNIMLWVSIGIAVGALLGATVTTHLPAVWLKNSFGVVVLVIALQMAFYAHKQSLSTHTPSKLVAIGGITGIISAIMGIGGGAILVPSLVWYQVTMTAAIGCAALSGFVIAIFGSLGYIMHGLGHPDLPAWSLGYIYLPATLAIASTSVFTARIGVKLAYKLPTKKLKKFFAVFLLIIGIRMILG